jgi:bidirectional [NiFe] hydrogenase diaphorase subunit
LCATAATGTPASARPKSKGTKVFALAGSIKNTGLIEVPMGITLREIVFEIGGGVPGGNAKRCKPAARPAAAFRPIFRHAVDYESLRELGSIMGSGGMIIMDETASMVDVSRYFMEFCMTESCGKCVPCRVGTVHMYNLLDKIYKGQSSQRDLKLLEKLCDMVQRPACAAWARRRPTRSSARCATSATSILERLVDDSGNGARAEPTCWRCNHEKTFQRAHQNLKIDGC